VLADSIVLLIEGARSAAAASGPKAERQSGAHRDAVIASFGVRAGNGEPEPKADEKRIAG